MNLGRFSSRKFLMALTTVILVVANDGFGLGLDEASINNVVRVVISFLAAQGVVDSVKEFRNGKVPA